MLIGTIGFENILLGPGRGKREENLKVNLIQFLPTNELEIRHSNNIRRVAGLGSAPESRAQFFPL